MAGVFDAAVFDPLVFDTEEPFVRPGVGLIMESPVVSLSLSMEAESREISLVMGD